MERIVMLSHRTGRVPPLTAAHSAVILRDVAETLRHTATSCSGTWFKRHLVRAAPMEPPPTEALLSRSQPTRKRSRLEPNTALSATVTRFAPFDSQPPHCCALCATWTSPKWVRLSPLLPSEAVPFPDNTFVCQSCQRSGKPHNVVRILFRA